RSDGVLPWDACPHLSPLHCRRSAPPVQAHTPWRTASGACPALDTLSSQAYTATHRQRHVTRCFATGEGAPLSWRPSANTVAGEIAVWRNRTLLLWLTFYAGPVLARPGRNWNATRLRGMRLRWRSCCTLRTLHRLLQTKISSG